MLLLCQNVNIKLTSHVCILMCYVIILYAIGYEGKSNVSKIDPKNILFTTLRGVQRYSLRNSWLEGLRSCKW